MDAKMLAAGATVIFAANAAWLYLFSLTGFGFADAFDYTSFFNLLNAKIVIVLLVTGAVMAASITATLFFSSRMGRVESLVMVGASGAATAAASFVISRSAIAALAAATFVIGLAVLAISKKEVPGGFFSKIGAGWGSAKKVLFVFSIGALGVSLLFGFANNAAYSERAKSSLLNFSGNMMSGLDISGSIGSDTVVDMCTSQVTKSSIQTLYETTMGDQWTSLTAAQRQDLVNQAYNDSITKCNSPAYIQQVMDTMDTQVKQLANQSKTGLVSGLLDSLPIMKTLFQLLPIFTALLIMSGLSLFGMLFVQPFTALFSLFLPASPKQPEKAPEKPAVKQFEKQSDKKQ